MPKNNRFFSAHPQPISMEDLRLRHPGEEPYSTDASYTQLANHIYSLLEDNLSFMGEDATKHASIGVTLYMEDILSETHQMEAFLNLYHRMFGYYLPFYATKNAKDESAELDRMRFVVWHCACCERHGNVLNPENIGIREMAEKLVSLFHTIQQQFGCKPNTELADSLFCVETLEDPMLVKKNIMWLESESFLGRWHTNRPEDDEYEFAKYFKGKDAKMLRYANVSLAAFDHQAWPLSIPAKNAYAEMLRIDSGDSHDPDAAAVEAIEFVSFRPLLIDGYRDGNLLVSDFQQVQYAVIPESGAPNFLRDAKKNNLMISALFKYQGKWNICGVTPLLKEKQAKIEELFSHLREEHHYMHDYVGQYDAFIKSNGGRRVFFVKNLYEYLKFQKRELGLKQSTDIEPLFDVMTGEGYTIFFEDNGQMTISHTASAIQHAANPYYSKSSACDDGFGIIVHDGNASPGLVKYLLENNLLPDAGLNDMRGNEYGWQLMQENAEFLARCFRRDIKETEVFCPRREVPLPTQKPVDPWDEESANGRMPLKDFLNKIRVTKTFVSPANKHWYLQKANKHIVSVVDDREKVVEIDTDDLYRAYSYLESYEFVLDEIKLYVHNNQASAALAVLHTIAGRGALFANMRQMLQQMGFQNFEDLMNR